jgi:hypothetical protein
MRLLHAKAAFHVAASLCRGDDTATERRDDTATERRGYNKTFHPGM